MGGHLVFLKKGKAMTDIEYWKNKWSEAQLESSLAPGYQRKDNWEAFWDRYAPRYARDNRERLPFFRQITNHLFGEGVFSEGSRVLDIGCGPGTFAIPLALQGAEVFGLDSAYKMLEVLQQEADFHGIGNRIYPLHNSWMALPETREYDLIIGANTPAIKDYDSLMRMNRLSGNKCCLISFTGSYHSRFRRDIWQHMMEAPLMSRAFDIQYPFNILYLEGCYPNTRFFPFRWETRDPVEEVIEHYTEYFTLFGVQGEEAAGRIRDFVTEKTDRQTLHDVQEGVMAVIWWSV